MENIIDNSVEFLKKMGGKAKEPEGTVVRDRRRIIHRGLLRDRGSRFAPTIRGEDFMQGGSLLDSSGAVCLGPELPSPAELTRKEELKEVWEKSKDKFPLPKNPRGDRLKI